MGRERYDLGDETRNKGLRELTDQGLLGLARRPVPAVPSDERFRARNVYMLRPRPGPPRARGDPQPRTVLRTACPQPGATRWTRRPGPRAGVVGHGALRAVIYEPGQDGHELNRRPWPASGMASESVPSFLT
jgi:hypothetical protein